jgi:hypothetical protein
MEIKSVNASCVKWKLNKPLNRCKFLALTLWVSIVGWPQEIFSQNKNATLKVETEHQTFYGKALAVDQEHVALMRTNGRFSLIDRNQIVTMETVANRFLTLSGNDMRASLEKEFGKKYEVSVTENFVVVHPRGGYQQWALPFERLYEQFRQFFWSRGFALDNPEFPLVAVVLNSREEFDQFLRAYSQYDPKIQGYYSPMSNRIITYRPAPGENESFFAMSTLIHEATHQVAFNTGIHSRLAVTPRWVSEGLAMMFEARGVHSSFRYNGLNKRVNRYQLHEFKHYVQNNQIRGQLQELLTSDDPFQADPMRAYAIAWGLSFYACETHGADYTRYLKTLGTRPDFQAYDAEQRLQDFRKFFGNDVNEFEVRMIRYLTNL